LPWGTLTEVRDVWVLPSVRQRLGLALFSIGVGLIASTGGLALIAADQDSDPPSAFALAPVQAPPVATVAAKSVPEVPLVQTVLARVVTHANPTRTNPGIAKREDIKPCGASSADDACLPDTKSTPEPAAPESNSPAAAVLPTGHVSDGTIVTELHLAASRESAPSDEISTTRSTDAALAVVETPTQESPPTKPRKMERQQSGQRHPYQQSWALFDSHPRRGRQQRFWPFW
jgi:hypothetical protein